MAEGRGGRVAGLHVSKGGVPKLAVARVTVAREGIEGDGHHDLRYHGGPERAVSIFSREVMDRVRSEGHPLAPGTAGENLLLEGLEWSSVAPGARLRFAGGVTLEVVSYCVPCRTIAGSFRDGAFERISQKTHPGESRVYARVLEPGIIAVGEEVSLVTAELRSPGLFDAATG